MRRYGLEYRQKEDWFDIVVILPLAALIVFPDKILQWVADRTGREFGWRHVVLIEVVAIGSLGVLMDVFVDLYPVERWRPLYVVGAFGMLRVVILFVEDLFGFRRD
jgi:hypothetical protein